GGADDPVPAPGDHEEHGLVGAEEDPGRGVDAVLGHDEVDALGRPDVDLSAAADEFLDVVGPDAGGVDDLLGADLAGRVALEVADSQPGVAFAYAQEADALGAGGDLRAVLGGGAQRHHHEAGVVDLRVPQLYSAGEGVLAQGRREPQRAPPGEVPVVGDA